MKRDWIMALIGVACFCVIVGCLGAAGYLVRGEFRFAGTWQDEWQALGKDLAADGTMDPNGVYAEAESAPSASQRGAAYFEAHYQTFDLPEYWNYIEIRASGATENAVNAYGIYVRDNSGQGDYLPATVLTFTTGTQANTGKTGYEFADTLAAVDTILAGSAHSPTGNNVAIYRFDRRWIKRIGVVCTTHANNGYIEIIGY
jgi:hypothetical protein